MVHRLQVQYHLVSLANDHVGGTLLHWVISWDTGKLDLGEYNSEMLNTHDREGLTAVHIAVSNRNIPAASCSL